MYLRARKSAKKTSRVKKKKVTNCLSFRPSLIYLAHSGAAEYCAEAICLEPDCWSSCYYRH